MAKRPELSAGLAGLAVNKGALPAPSTPPDLDIKVDPPLADIMEDGPGLTLHLKRHSYIVLKQLALDERTTVHALLVEGLQKLFESRNCGGVALAGNRPGSPKRTDKKEPK